jgi:hypothetical protein
MTTVLRRALRALALGAAFVCLTAATAMAQAPAEAPAPPEAGAGVPSHDCSRWPASIYDDASATCVCPQNMWWNLRGDACLPKEHAAGEFCSTVWPGSQPAFGPGGSYRCVCAPPLLWNAEATACRMPPTIGEDDCTRQWPGTLPVLSPSGVEFECRCPGGRRWDESTSTCVGGAPVVRVSPGFFSDGAAPGQGPAEAPVPPAAAVAPAPGFGPPSSATAPAFTPPPASGPAPSPAYAPPPAAGAAAPPPSTGNPACDSLLAEIRARAQAGQASQADALGMKAAIAGCDPKAISDASRSTRPTQR